MKGAILPKIFSLGNHNNASATDQCSPDTSVPADLRDRTAVFCTPNEPDPCQQIGRKKQFGEKANCDPMQSGSIINDLTKPTRNVVNRYSNALRGCDQGMIDLFRNLVVLDEDGKAWPVPIIWGTQEKAVAAIIQKNVRKDNSLVVDRPVLPFMAIHSSELSFARDRYIYHKAQTIFRSTDNQQLTQTELRNKDTVFGVTKGLPIDVGYTLYVWTYYVEDMNQIVEQILLKFSPITYIKVQEVFWEIGVTLDSVANNIDTEPGDKAERVVKYQFNFTAQTYIPQPVTRNKTVLGIKTDFFNSVNENEMTQVFDRQEVGTFVND